MLPGTPERLPMVLKIVRRRVAAADASVSQGLAILYGGSVKGSNAPAIFAKSDVDGGLIGGASLVAEDFLAILKAAAV